eukprot:gnl/Dysnectes_brevis/1008_a1124_4654.p1 GENE.gnl/Dysnectes_brevis/1008_a1124_4654~~gnl/Dysnectes_brevis/1008_a1124_4654.p1  ORF type:complete len:449 (+),score=147.51 gnl/Dysnectes_brevis/1008_a1124_4654:68-1414(+)
MLALAFLLSFIAIAFCDDKVIITDYPLSQIDLVHEKTLVTADDIFPNITEIPSYSGFIGVNPTYDSNIFFWSFDAINQDPNAPIIVWMSGGPGCSDELGSFQELGMYKYLAGMDGPTLNPYSWNQEAVLLLFDNPVGAGYSYTQSDDGYPITELQVATDYYAALSAFFAYYPEYSGRPLYIAGESYAGHYTVAVAHYILDHPSPAFNLQLVAAGDGMTHPVQQVDVLSEFAHGTGFIDKLQQQKIYDRYESKAVKAIQEERWDEAHAMFTLTQLAIEMESGIENVYNVYMYDTSYDPDFDVLDDLFNEPATRAALHVGSNDWTDCDDIAYEKLSDDFFQSSLDDVKAVIDAGVQMVVYTGNQDLIIPHLSQEAWLYDMEWEHQEDWLNAKREKWTIQGTQEIVGAWKRYDNLHFVTVYDSGHLVPRDQPEPAFDMIRRFFSGQWPDLD